MRKFCGRNAAPSKSSTPPAGSVESRASQSFMQYQSFPQTRWTLVLSARAGREDAPCEAVKGLALAYWQRMKGQTILDKAQAELIAGYINWWQGEFMENDRRVRSFGRTQESPIMSWSES